MSAQGRPLRFLVLVIGGWTGARVALLWPAAVPPIRVPNLLAPPAAAAPLHREVRGAPVAWTAVPPDAGIPTRLMVAPAAQSPRAEPSAGHAFVLVAPTRASAPPTQTLPDYGAAAPISPQLPLASSRWSASTWAIVRDGEGRAGLATPQLGGSQAGVRLAYRLDEAGRFAAVARVAAALRTRQQEAAVGLEWRPTRLPLRLVAEQRIALANARGGPSLGIVGGVSAVPIAGPVHLDGYVQAGVIARDGAEGYADGAARLGATVARAGDTRLELGLGAWGAAQRNAERVDIGPGVTLVVPVAGRGVRLGVEWRERVAGRARPGSGAVLSLGADF